MREIGKEAVIETTFAFSQTVARAYALYLRGETIDLSKKRDREFGADLTEITRPRRCGDSERDDSRA